MAPPAGPAAPVRLGVTTCPSGDETAELLALADDREGEAAAAAAASSTELPLVLRRVCMITVLLSSSTSDFRLPKLDNFSVTY